jgi:CRISPR-associated endonuclease/helicase Cas3
VDGESLGDHTRRVLYNIARLRRRNPDLDQICQMPRFWPRLLLAASVHDLGKCAKAFQETVRGGDPFKHRHEVLSALFLRWLLADDPSGDLPWSAAAVLTHHKDWNEVVDLYPPDLAAAIVRPILTPEFLVSGKALFASELLPELTRLGVALPHGSTTAAWEPGEACQELARIISAVDRLNRSIQRQSYNSPDVVAGRFLRGALIIADHSGSAHVALQRSNALASPELALGSMKRAWDGLYEHQRQLSAVTSSAILTAPTGSGKTEGAILWAASVRASQGGEPVLFYVLPYQASVNAMRARLAGDFGESHVSLQHSKALQSLYRVLLEHGYGPLQAAAIAHKQRELARLYATPIRALTPYQLLRAAFQLKGHEAIWTDASAGLMVFDEIHAYDLRRLGMILASLRHMTRDLGIRALFMSATLPHCLHEVLRSLLPGCADIRATEETYLQFRRHQVHTLNVDLLDSSVLERIAHDASAGLAVLVVATTVGRAQEVYRKLRDRIGGGVELLHGRFHAEDRFKKECQLLQSRGPGSPTQGPLVLVSTQVVEVSLDVDFDVLYSDPAPLEALLQRFGRVNRRRRHALRDVFVMRSVPKGSPVYEEELVTAAVSQLAAIDGQALDESDIQTLLDSTYAGDRGQRWAAAIKQSIEKFETRVLASLRPFATDESIEDLFDQMFDGAEVLPISEEQRYIKRREEQPLLCSALLVPVTRGQFMSLLKAGALQKRHDVWVVDRPYSEAEGLQVKASPGEDGI